jgi:hypothetical protein
MSVLSAGTAAAALAGTHSVARHALAARCKSICVRVQAAGTSASGQAVSFGIRISPVSLLDDVTVRISVAPSQPPAFSAPAFTSCPSGEGTQICTVGVLQAGQATELKARIFVPGSAPGGDMATLSATATGALLGVIGTGSATGSATVSVIRSPPTSPSSPPPSSPSPGGRHPSPGEPGGRPPAPGPDGLRLGAGFGGLAPGAAPPLSDDIGGIAPYSNPASLFPLISPSTASGPGRSRQARAAHLSYRATAVSGALPLSIRQVYGQIAALIALAIGIVVAVVRVESRRRQRP